TNAIVDRIAIGHRTKIGPDRYRADTQVAVVAAGGGSVWICCTRDGSILEVDPTTDRVMGPIRTGSFDLSYAQVFAYAYVSLWIAYGCACPVARDGAVVFRYDIAHRRLVGPVTVGTDASAITVGE